MIQNSVYLSLDKEHSGAYILLTGDSMATLWPW